MTMPKRECQILDMSEPQAKKGLLYQAAEAEGLHYFCLEPYFPKRSLSQNAYWFAVVIPILSQHLREGTGDSSWTNDAAHEFSKMLWLPAKTRKLPDGSEITTPTSSTELSTKEFSTLTDEAILWLGEQGIAVPSPDQYFDTHKRKDYARKNGDTE